VSLTWLDGCYAHGRENIYLIARTPGGELRLSRWRRAATALPLPHLHLLVARQAASNAITVTGHDQAHDIASRFEAGDTAAWPRTPGQPRPEQEAGT
jgi:hypothetical protein